MGSFDVLEIKNNKERNQFYQNILNDMDAFQYLLDEEWIEDKGDMIGAEQEICIINNDFQPLAKSLQILEDINDDHYTNELALYNLEINLDPEPLLGNCFQNVENDLLKRYSKGQSIANKHKGHLFLSGILPTLQYRHLQYDYMTPIKRYKYLSDALLKTRGDHFEILLQGVDDFNVSLSSILFEACNTSFQTHLQVSPKNFVEQFNWSQMIAGPVLSIATNSPFLFGRELWAETRIGLFKQSIDTRNRNNHIRKKVPRVYFGKNWVQKSPVEVWKNSIMAFPLLLRTDDNSNWKDEIKAGICPKLKSIRLHTGTSYNWNRLCYGIHNNSPHIRIECRYLPSGPTIIDEIANFAFWVGLMKGQGEQNIGFWKNTDFREAKDNFIRAARTGINSMFNWFGKSVSASDLILNQLIPMARKGLELHGVNKFNIDKYLGIIEQRTKRHQTGSIWQTNNFRRLIKNNSFTKVGKILTESSLEYQNNNIPVHEWADLSVTTKYGSHLSQTVEHCMKTEVFTILEKLSISVALKIMTWGDFHHLPVEDSKGNLCGILSDTDIKQYKGDHNQTIDTIMSPQVLCANPTDLMTHAKQKMNDNKINCLPVLFKDKLVGILTSTDIND